MATKTLTTVVALTAALTLSIAGTAMADTLIQGGFDDRFADGVEIGRGAVINAPEVVGGFGDSMVNIPLVTTTGGSGLNDFGLGFGGNTRGVEYTFNWSAANAPGDGSVAFAGVGLLNNFKPNLQQNTGLAIEIENRNSSANVRFKFTITDVNGNTYQNSTAGENQAGTGAFGTTLTTDFDNANWQLAEAGTNNMDFFTSLGNVQRIGFSFVMPTNLIGGEPTTTVTFDNLRVTPEPSSMIMLGAGCMLLMSSRKLRRA